MVDKYRNDLSGNDAMIESRKVKRGDQEYTVDTSNIGNGQKDEEFEYDEEILDQQVRQ